MPEPFEVRICARKQPNGKVELSAYSVADRKEMRTGVTVWPGDDMDREIARMKQTFERAGHRVTFVEMK